MFAEKSANIRVCLRARAGARMFIYNLTGVVYAIVIKVIESTRAGRVAVAR